MLALWAFVAVPTTCGGGLLVHACEDGADPVCHHEESCPADPCNVPLFPGPSPEKVRAGEDADLPPSPAAPTPATRCAHRPPDADAAALPPPVIAVPLRC